MGSLNISNFWDTRFCRPSDSDTYLSSGLWNSFSSIFSFVINSTYIITYDTNDKSRFNSFWESSAWAYKTGALCPPPPPNFAIAIIRAKNLGRIRAKILERPFFFVPPPPPPPRNICLCFSEYVVISPFIFLHRFILHAKKTGFVVEHDFIMATYLADRVIVFDGTPSIDTRANT